MAYSDYGGYAFRNGLRVEARSDAVIKPEGDVFGTPGIYPQFGMLRAGMSQADVTATVDWPSGHVVLGDGPIYVVLRKQWVAGVYRGPVRLPQSAGIATTALAGDEGALALEVDAHRIEVVYLNEDNLYVYARLTQPDGTRWHGWSGYGVGAGLEDCGYGFSTSARNRTLLQLWPEAIALLEGGDHGEA